jgi:hypothetical protein
MNHLCDIKIKFCAKLKTLGLFVFKFYEIKIYIYIYIYMLLHAIVLEIFFARYELDMLMTL